MFVLIPVPAEHYKKMRGGSTSKKRFAADLATGKAFTIVAPIWVTVVELFMCTINASKMRRPSLTARNTSRVGGKKKLS